MKPFNIFVVISFVLIVAGFIFFKDGFNKDKSSVAGQSELLMNTPGYLNYSDSRLVDSQKKGTSVLFFAATKWCQTCILLEKEILERSAEIPKDTTILKVDYDNDKVMNQKYGVTSQHTLVVLDKNGKELKRWIGGYFDTLLQELEKT